MTLAILTEKPSAGRAFAAALGGVQGVAPNGESYVIVSARGHLFELAPPEAQLTGATADEASKMKSWDLADLPWDSTRFAWSRVPIKDTKQTLDQLRAVLGRVDEIVIATDLDPTGEGDAIAWNIIDELKLHHKRFSRMEFTDEAPASLQRAFAKRRPVKGMLHEGDYLKANFRDRFDFLTIQFTRVASRVSGQNLVLRQGRLKSAMVKLVGDQLQAHKNYVKVTQFQNRFRDENGVLYTNPEEPRFATEAEVPRPYGPSRVVLDKRTNKATPPRRLLDLAGLSARLSSKGVKADQVLATYQKMYEAQVVSYPRTEDKTITTEQFNELLPFVNKIAAVVGVDPSLLTHRAPRKTHVKDAGAHGANRPGPKVPASLDALKTTFGPIAPLIYMELGRSYLAMLAEDYLYEAQDGHLTLYPAFVGRANVPKSMGWKLVFSDADEKDESDAEQDQDNANGLGTVGQPIVFEIIPPRPEHPSMKWLMKQLEKRDVGTGATRTSTYADVTNARARFPLLAEARGKLTMTEAGDMSHRLLPGTRIGDLELTERVYAIMRDVASGKTSADKELAQVAAWVREDIITMQKNATQMRVDLGLKAPVQAERAEGVWAETGQPVKFRREWSGHRFTDQQVTDLLAGREIVFQAFSAKRNNAPFEARGKLALQTMERNGKSYPFVGFKPEFGPRRSAAGQEMPPAKMCGHAFTPTEIDDLLKGRKIYVDDFVSKKGKEFAATVHFAKEIGGKEKKIIFEFA
ncbi:DNA topoisomerase [Microbacterium sp. SL62]|uniref:DNA topoisomerase n=1 Tax=Microbacterium sp. SL62 TaxID=2995139 RepID=UPI0022750BD4|nr:DNA topoisomerase [Microbacterium sp. SL62]MCY1718487.1 DNA topoisomerase [Microbacterium sp. SL62]